MTLANPGGPGCPRPPQSEGPGRLLVLLAPETGAAAGCVASGNLCPGDAELFPEIRSDPEGAGPCQEAAPSLLPGRSPLALQVWSSTSSSGNGSLAHCCGLRGRVIPCLCLLILGDDGVRGATAPRVHVPT